MRVEAPSTRDTAITMEKKNENWFTNLNHVLTSFTFLAFRPFQIIAGEFSYWRKPP